MAGLMLMVMREESIQDVGKQVFLSTRLHERGKPCSYIDTYIDTYTHAKRS
jgi:hypothetical protein